MKIYDNLTEANAARHKEWTAGGQPIVDLEFRVIELIGELGEAANIIKKLMREERGWRGSRATVEELADELADVGIVLNLLEIEVGEPFNGGRHAVTKGENHLLALTKQIGNMADIISVSTSTKNIRFEIWRSRFLLHALARQYGIDIDTAIARKFNVTSEKYGLSQRMVVPGHSPEQPTQLLQLGTHDECGEQL